MSYKSQTQINIENSPKFAVRHWRNLPEEQETALDAFLFWLEYEMQHTQQYEIRDLADKYLGRDKEKIKRGESELLAEWIAATTS